MQVYTWTHIGFFNYIYVFCVMWSVVHKDSHKISHNSEVGYIGLDLIDVGVKVPVVTSVET